MKTYKLILARTNIGLTINKLLMRKKKEPDKSEGINTMIKDLDEVIAVVNDFHDLLSRYESAFLEMQKEVLILRREKAELIEKLNQKEIEI